MRDNTGRFSPSKVLFTNLAGVTFVDEFDTLIEGLQPGDELTLVEEPDNPHDPNAISVSLPTGEHLGYIPRDIASEAPKPLTDYSVVVSRVSIATDNLNAGLGVKIYRNDITEKELYESVKDIISREDLADFIILAYESAGKPSLDAAYEISSRVRIRNVIRHLNQSGVSLDAILFGDDITKVVLPGIKVVSEPGLTTLYADDIHKVFDTRGRVSLTGHILRDVVATITGHEVSLGHLDDLIASADLVREGGVSKPLFA